MLSILQKIIFLKNLTWRPRWRICLEMTVAMLIFIMESKELIQNCFHAKA